MSVQNDCALAVVRAGIPGLLGPSINVRAFQGATKDDCSLSQKFSSFISLLLCHWFSHIIVSQKN